MKKSKKFSLYSLYFLLSMLQMNGVQGEHCILTERIQEIVEEELEELGLSDYYDASHLVVYAQGVTNSPEICLQLTAEEWKKFNSIPSYGQRMQQKAQRMYHASCKALMRDFSLKTLVQGGEIGVVCGLLLGCARGVHKSWIRSLGPIRAINTIIRSTMSHAVWYAVFGAVVGLVVTSLKKSLPHVDKDLLLTRRMKACKKKSPRCIEISFPAISAHIAALQGIKRSIYEVSSDGRGFILVTTDAPAQ